MGVAHYLLPKMPIVGSPNGWMIVDPSFSTLSISM
jgi:hypothetical protein